MGEAGQTGPADPPVPLLGAQVLAEFWGTFILVMLGNGAVTVSVLTGSYDVLGVAFAWTLAVALAVYAVAAVSGAHINPAVTLAFAVFTDFPWRKVAPYIGAQLLGAFVAAAVVHASFSGVLAAFETTEGIERSQPGSQLSAMAHATYAPNPAIIGTDADALAQVSHVQWFSTEMIMAALLVFGVMFLIEERNTGRPLANVAGLMIGLLVGVLVAYGSPISMTAINPARDLGPRLFALFAGWGDIAFPGPRNGFWIPAVSTLVGGVIGGAAYTFALKPLYPAPAEVGRTPPEVVADGGQE